jgi:general secretion pathway protein M
MIRLTRREKLGVITLATFTTAWLLFVYAVKPAMGRLETLARVMPEKQRDLRALRAKADEYDALRQRLRDLRTNTAPTKETIELLPFLESLTRQCRLVKKVAAIKQHVSQPEPNCRQTIVEVKLENLTLTELVDFLWKVESSKALASIKSLYIKKNPTDTTLLDSVIEIHTVELTQN